MDLDGEETSQSKSQEPLVGSRTSAPAFRASSSTSIPSAASIKGVRRSNTGRASLVWKTFEDGDFENELASELESRWQSGSNAGSMMHQTVKSACKRIWGRPFNNLCLHSDLPRLSHNLEIVDERNGQMVRLSRLFHSCSAYPLLNPRYTALHTLVYPISVC